MTDEENIAAVFFTSNLKFMRCHFKSEI